jgi:steroid delta-isomerase-like uncharacterized protein
MSVEDNKAVVRRSIEEGENRADLGVLEDCYATDYVHHDPDNPAVRDWPGLKQAFRGYFGAFPDGHVVIDDLIAEGDKVVKRWTSRGTHQGEFAGIPATGKQVSYTGTVTYRLAGGKIVEAWWNYDLFGMLQQLGAMPAPAELAATMG